MAETKYASFAPESIKESGGSNLWDNVDATITGFKFTREMPDNYKIEPKPGEEISPIGVLIDFEVDGGAPVEERRVNQFFSVGAKVGLAFDIAANGFGLVPKTEDAQLYASNFTKFVKSLVDNGLPAPVVAAGDFSKILGLKGHFKRIEDKNARERTWKDKKGVEHKEFPKVLLCTKVNGLPTGNVATTGSAPGAPTTADAGDFDLDSATAGYLTAALAAKKKPLQRAQLVLVVSQQAVNDPNRQAIAKRSAEEEFLTNLAALDMIVYDAAGKGQPVSLPVAA